MYRAGGDEQEARATSPTSYADPDYTYPAMELGGYPDPARTPVLFEEEPVGVIGLARNEVRPFEGGEIELMATFADQSAIALANAKLFETVERQKAELARFLSPEVAALVSSDEGAQLLAGHRAYITVIYFDLRGFTAFAEAAEPEELINVVREYHAAAGELVLAYGGRSSTSRATGSWCSSTTRCPRSSTSSRRRGWRSQCASGSGSSPAAGASAGTSSPRRRHRRRHATLCRIGFEGQYDYGALGIVASLAARLSDEAAAGQILLSQRAYAALEGGLRPSPVAKLQMKGFARSVQAYEFLRVVDL